MTTSTVDGLGYEEIGQVGSQVSSLWATGSIVADAGVQATTTSGADIYAAGSVQANEIIADNSLILTSTDAEGVIAKGFNAEAIITGGMWVVGSVASGTTPTVVIKPAAAGTDSPLGICIATVASGAVAEVLIKGPYKGMIAEGTLNNGVPFAMGSGAALNVIQAVGVAGQARGTVMMGGGSEAETVVYLC